MRLVQVTIPAGKRETVLATLDDKGIDYVVTDETSGREYAAIATFPVPKNAVQPVLDALRDAGLGDDTFTVVLDANTVVSRRFEQLKEEYAEEEDEGRISREELTAAAETLAPSTQNYIILTIISALIATAGLLLNSPAVVVGSMVIAPLVGPAMAASVGTVVNDRELASRGIRLQIGGLLLSILTAALFALAVRYTNLIPPLIDVTSVEQIEGRVAPDFLSLVVALGAGVAGIISLTSGVSTALVGVMIAVALIPPAATVGIGIAWGAPLVTLGSTVLTLVNVLSINFAALVVLWYSGYRPQHWFRHDEAKSTTRKRIAVLLVSIVVLSAFLGGVTLDSYSRATTETSLQEQTELAVEEVNETREFNIHLIDTEVRQTNTVLFQRPDRLIVTVGIPPGRSVESLSGAIDRRVAEVLDRNITVEVRYVTTETT